MNATPFPPDPNPHKPRLVAPPGSWDCHFHIYGPPQRFPYAESRSFTPGATPIEHWLATSKAIGIERGVLVTPAIHGTDPACTLDAIARSGGRILGVVRADATLTPDDIARLHRGGIRGMRFPFARELGRAFDANVLRANLANIESAGWIAQLQVDDDVIERHAETLAAIPLPVVLDGMVGIDAKRGIDQPLMRALFDLLKRPNIYLKVMCADREMHRGQRYEDIVTIFRAIIAHAPDQVIWGTDWPHSYLYDANQVPNDGDLIDMLLDFAPQEAVRKKLLVDNPKRLWEF